MCDHRTAASDVPGEDGAARPVAGVAVTRDLRPCLLQAGPSPHPVQTALHHLLRHTHARDGPDPGARTPDHDV